MLVVGIMHHEIQEDVLRTVAFDTETGGLSWFEPEEQAFLITWADADGAYYADVRDDAAVLRFIRTIQSADEIVGHNLPFDIHMVRATLGIDILGIAEYLGTLLHDTHLYDVVLFPEGQRKGRGGHGLEAMTQSHLGRGRKADDVDELAEAAKALGGSLHTSGMYRRIYEADPDLMIRYAVGDAQDTYDLFHVMREKCAAAPENLRRVVELEHQLMPIVIRAEQRGVRTDQAEVIKFKGQFERQEHELRERLMTELGGVPQGPSDDAEFLFDGKGSKRALVEALQNIGVPLTERSPKTGAISTSKAALAPHVPDFPIIEDLFEWRRVVRFLNTYIGPMVGRDVIHTSYQQNEAWTGRMASRRPNMQNWPRRAGQEVRNVLQAREGHSLVIADFAQMEAMIIVRYMNDPGLIEAMENGLDMNAFTASLIWGGTPADWGKDTPNAEGERSRATARHTLYATLYGAGAGRVTQQLPFLDRGPYYELGDEDGVLRDRDTGALILVRPWKNTTWPRPGWQFQAARDLQNAIKNNMPGYKEFVRRMSDKIDDVGYVNTYYGRQNPIPRDKKYVAVAGIVQGTGADVLKLAAVKAAPALALLGGQLLMFTHDELVAEVPDEHAEQALAALIEAMETAAPDHRPHFRADGSIVKHYGEGH